MNIRIALFASVGYCLALPAFAASITNKDDKDQGFTIVEGSTKSARVLKSGAVLDGVCLAGCIVRLGESSNDEYELEAADKVSIEDGLIYLDGVDGGGGPASGAEAPGAKN